MDGRGAARVACRPHRARLHGYLFHHFMLLELRAPAQNRAELRARLDDRQRARIGTEATPVLVLAGRIQRVCYLIGRSTAGCGLRPSEKGTQCTTSPSKETSGFSLT